MLQLELLENLYNYAKNNDSTGVLNTSKELTLMGVCNSVQNRVLLLSSSYCVIECLSVNIQSIFEEYHFISQGCPAEKLEL